MRKKITKVEVQFYTDEIAESVRRVAIAVEAMRNSGLKEDAIVTLLHDCTRVGKPAIRQVLWGLNQLKHFYLTAAPKPSEETAEDE